MIKKTKGIYLFWIFLLISTSLLSQVGPDYQEANDPHPDNNAQWDQIPKGLHASFANPLLKFAKGAVPILPNQQTNPERGFYSEILSESSAPSSLSQANQNLWEAATGYNSLQAAVTIVK